jgi:hypothetical protein
MKVQETQQNNKLLSKNKTSRKELEESKRELNDKNDMIEDMGASLERMAQFS